MIFTRMRWAKALEQLWLCLVALIFVAPIVVVAIASLNEGSQAYLVFPPERYSLRWYSNISDALWHALWISLTLAFTAATIATIIGVPAAIFIARQSPRIRQISVSVGKAPLQLPHVVIGVSFLQLYYWIADRTEILLIGTWTGLLLAHVFICLPYVLSSTVDLLQRIDPTYEEAAELLGATPLVVLWTVTLRLASPGIYTGWLYAFLGSFTDVPVSLFLSGPGFTTFPAEIFGALDYEFNPGLLAIAMIVVAGSLALMITMRRVIGAQAMCKSLNP